MSTISVRAQEKPLVDIGGALRFNYNYSSWKDAQKKRGGDLGYDVFRLNAKAEYKGLKFNAEYRFYSQDFGGAMLKQGWIAYNFNENDELQFGLIQVPFGITKYNSNSWFFSLNYYVGLEDDHDMGLKFIHLGEKWDYSLAFFKNAEELRFGSNSDVSNSRYSYDVSSIDLNGDSNLNIRNKEVNQLNGNLSYKIDNANAKHRFGVSAQHGALFNLDTEQMGEHYALATYYELQAGKFGVKAQIANYKYSPENLTGEPDDVIAMTAYGAPYLVAAEASIYTLGLSYAIPLEWGLVSSVVIYNDFGYMDKAESHFENSIMNVTGAMFTAGNIYTYFDLAAAKNQPWLGSEWTNALAAGTRDADWEMRFNINIGYYF
ncbi:hypothetical protein DWB61_08110 [Ancylomarina euxinus]|uniref:Porin n=1 Tax=Ancylomarina euxinus TaxID=2283627 RepID=A0A425Y2R8_9BACT|nr:hypothetical protein [Ancylomarina euxinus]MCZ4694951.1 hypothetical protein [Ancylomarina euxinus]MUP14817.1 hypothetical protein [Ancylomarina euxinus]RRG22161.1 hypothetical protein DWB61_08110 [Ancylomarina euxinus]